MEPPTNDLADDTPLIIGFSILIVIEIAIVVVVIVWTVRFCRTRRAAKEDLASQDGDAPKETSPPAPQTYGSPPPGYSAPGADSGESGTPPSPEICQP
jgi:hypothetical protein